MKVQYPRGEWNISRLLEVEFDHPDDFLKIKEVLTRIGISSNDNKSLYQTCHILHKRGKYYIVHFKDLMAIDGNKVVFQEKDLQRRDRIAKLLEEWEMIRIKNPQEMQELLSMKEVKIISRDEKDSWSLMPKYRFKSDRK